MRDRVRVASVFLVLAIIHFLGSGCAPTPEIPIPTMASMTHLLNEILLDPTITCETLRAQFGVDELPLAANPGEAGLEYEEAFVVTPDGIPLRTWYMPAGASRGVVVVSMGAVGDMSCYLFTSQLLVNLGFSVVTYDYRGFGGSGGEVDVTQLATDLEAVLDWARSHTGQRQVTLAGISLGSIPAIAVASRRPDAVNAIMLDSPVSLEKMIERFTFVLREKTQAYILALAPDLASEDLLEDVFVPVLMMVGSRDRLTTPESVQALFDHAPGPKVFGEIPDVGHARGIFYQTSVYLLFVESFLADIWDSQRISPVP